MQNTFIEEIGNAEKRVADLEIQVRQLADRLVGSQPEQDSMPEEGPSSALLDRAAYSGRQICNAVSRIEDDLRRVAQSLPAEVPSESSFAGVLVGTANALRCR